MCKQDLMNNTAIKVNTTEEIYQAKRLFENISVESSYSPLKLGVCKEKDIIKQYVSLAQATELIGIINRDNTIQMKYYNKNEPYCSDCNTNVNYNSNFCPNCGIGLTNK